MIIINITTISDKVDLCSATLWSILRQSIKPDKVILWISSDAYMADHGIPEVPDYIAELNKILNIFEVKYTNNIGPYRKIIPALRLYKNNEILIYADDDVVYGVNWIKKMLKCFIDNGSQYPVAVRVRKVKRNFLGVTKSYLAFPIISSKNVLSNDYVITGIGGCLLTAKNIKTEYISMDDFISVSPMTDDLWISKILILSETKLVTCPEALEDVCEIQNNYASLSSINNRITKHSNYVVRLLMRFRTKILSHFGFNLCNNDYSQAMIDKFFSEYNNESSK